MSSSHDRLSPASGQRQQTAGVRLGGSLARVLLLAVAMQALFFEPKTERVRLRESILPRAFL